MDEKQIRGRLGDKIAHLKERLTFTRPRTLQAFQCLAIENKIDELLLLLPKYNENVVYEQD